MNEKDLERLEGKIDTLSEAINKLVLLEERQSLLVKQVDKLESQHDHTRDEIVRIDSKIDKWVNRGFGAYGILVMILTYVKYH